MQAALLCGLGLATSVMFLPGLLNVSTAPRWAALAIGIPICVLFSRWQRSASTSAVQGIWIIFAAFAAALFTGNAIDGADDLVHVAILLSAFYLGAIHSQVTAVWIGIEIGVAISALIAVAQVFGFDWIPQTVVPGGLFMNKNLLGEAAVVAAVTAFMGRRWLLLAAALVALGLATTRGAAGALVVVFALWLRPQRQFLSAGILCAIASVAVLSFVVGDGDSSAAQRLGLWQEVYSSFTTLGHGLGSFAVDYPEAHFAHSEPLQLLYELGVFVGLPLGLLAFALGGKNERPTERLLLIAVMAVSLFSFPLHMPLTAFAAAIAWGHLVGSRGLVLQRKSDRGGALGSPA